MRKKIQLREKLRWTDLLEDKRIISSSICSDGSVLLLAVSYADKDKPFERYVAPSGASFAARHIDEAYPATLINVHDEYTEQVAVQTPFGFPLIERFRDGRFLIVGARCHIYSFDQGTTNAAIYSADGQLVNTFCLGDGIEKLCVTPNANIWVGYFDEGVFGDYAIAQSGIACFNDNGSNVWKYDPPSEELATMADCYALAANGNDVWACYYTDFPVVRISSAFEVQAWHNSVVGAKEIAVTRSCVLLFGGYGAERERCAIQTFGSCGDLENQIDVQLELSSGEPLSEARITARDGRIHAITNEGWHELWMDEIIH